MVLFFDQFLEFIVRRLMLSSEYHISGIDNVRAVRPPRVPRDNFLHSLINVQPLINVYPLINVNDVILSLGAFSCTMAELGTLKPTAFSKT